MKKLLLLTVLAMGCGGSSGPTVCDQANDLAQSAMNAYCAGRTCCICRCNNQETVMECGGSLWDCATPPYDQKEHPSYEVCPQSSTQAAYCLDDKTLCWDAWYALHQDMCEAYP